MIDEFGVGDLFGELLGNDIPASLRVLAPGFSMEKRLGPVIGGIGYYSAGFKITESQFLGMGQYDNTTTINFLHLYSFYPLIISTRISLGAGIGVGIPISGALECSGNCENTTTFDIEADDMENEINLLFNASFAITQTYGVRLYYQQGLSGAGDYYPMTFDDPETSLEFDGQGNIVGGDESVAGYKGLPSNVFGASLLIRF